jgi:hypothetical protein
MAPHEGAHIFLPDDQRLLEFLNSPEPVLKDEDYPEFREGAEAWVRTMRDADLRLEREKLGDWLYRGGSHE